MLALNLPGFAPKVAEKDGKRTIFDPVRQKYVALTPEEWVRQHVVQFLMQEKKYPKSLINVEKVLHVNGLRKRYDIVIFNPNGAIHALIECKAPHITISQATFDQIAQYNMTLQSQFLMVTNGLNHYYCTMDFENEKYEFLRSIPEYGPISQQTSQIQP